MPRVGCRDRVLMWCLSLVGDIPSCMRVPDTGAVVHVYFIYLSPIYSSQCCVVHLCVCGFSIFTSTLSGLVVCVYYVYFYNAIKDKSPSPDVMSESEVVFLFRRRHSRVCVCVVRMVTELAYSSIYPLFAISFCLLPLHVSCGPVECWFILLGA